MDETVLDYPLLTQIYQLHIHTVQETWGIGLKSDSRPSDVV